ncbi:MAG: hypothetical protein JRG89_22160, partial [Deltaproteobacteria bacterium]|nr:hypothetical protein [Deltaproteobacteria bacterium]
MPELDLGSLATDDEKAIGVYKLLTVMAWPREEDRKRRDYLVSYASKCIADGGGNAFEILFTEQGGHGAIHQSLPLAKLAKAMEDRMGRWLVAYHTLKMLMRLDGVDTQVVGDQASMNKVRHLILRMREIA